MKKSRMMPVAVMMAAMILTSCSSGKNEGPVTAASIMNGVVEKTANASSMEARVLTEIAMHYDLTQALSEEDLANMGDEDTDYDINISMDMDLQVVSDPVAVYIDADMAMDYDGGEEDYKYQTYGMTAEDGSSMTLYTGMNDEWYTETIDLTDTLQYTEEMTIAGDLAGYEEAGYELQEETETFNDREVYVLKGTLSGDLLQEISDAANSVTDLLGTQLDLTKKEAPVIYKVYKDSNLPATIEIDMTSVMNELMDELGASLTKTAVSYEFISFNEIDAINVPDQVVQNAIAYTMSDEPAEQEDVLVATTDDTVKAMPSGKEHPARKGDWTYAYIYCLDGTCFQLPVRVTDVTYGDEDGSIEKKFTEWYGDDFEGLEKDTQFASIAYEVYIPEDFPDETFYGLNIYSLDENGDYTAFNYGYCETLDYSEIEVGPGETAKGVAVTTAPVKDPFVLLEIGDSMGNECYIRCE